MSEAKSEDTVTMQATYLSVPMDIKTAVKAVVAKHGGVRAAARAIKVNYAYLSRLQTGEKSNPTAAVLRKLGLRKVVNYEAIRPVKIEDDEDRERREQQEFEDSLEDGPAYIHDIHGRDAQHE